MPPQSRRTWGRGAAQGTPPVHRWCPVPARGVRPRGHCMPTGACTYAGERDVQGQGVRFATRGRWALGPRRWSAGLSRSSADEGGRLQGKGARQKAHAVTSLSCRRSARAIKARGQLSVCHSSASDSSAPCPCLHRQGPRSLKAAAN